MDEHIGRCDQCTNSRIVILTTHAHIREWILLDSQSSIDYFTNPSNDNVGQAIAHTLSMLQLESGLLEPVLHAPYK